MTNSRKFQTNCVFFQTNEAQKLEILSKFANLHTYSGNI